VTRPSNNIAEKEAADAYRDAAVANGWSIKPTYEEHEPVTSAASLDKDGFHMSILARTNDLKLYPNVKRLYDIDISIWGPDGLAINPPLHYDMEAIRKGVRICSHCGKTDVDTVRYSFAGRCCKECLPAMRAKYEQSGWCD
jgi:hypothetical protein